MKPWAKILLWLTLGGTIGFAGGWQAGRRNKKGISEAYDNGYLDGYDDGYNDAEAEEQPKRKEFMKNVRETYAGAMQDEEQEDIPDMDMTRPVIDDESDGPLQGVPPLDPEDMEPREIDEDRYYNNPNAYDKIELLWYTGDSVLYRPQKREIIEQDEADRMLGIGALYEFPGSQQNPVWEIWRENDKFGAMYHVIRIDEDFCDAVDGTCGPEEDDEEY